MSGRGASGRRLSAGYYLGLAGLAGAVDLGEALRGKYGPAALLLGGVALLLLLARQAYRRDGKF